MSRLSTAVKRHPLIAFFVLAYALSWWPLDPVRLRSPPLTHRRVRDLPQQRSSCSRSPAARPECWGCCGEWFCGELGWDGTRPRS